MITVWRFKLQLVTPPDSPVSKKLLALLQPFDLGLSFATHSLMFSFLSWPFASEVPRLGDDSPVYASSGPPSQRADFTDLLRHFEGSLDVLPPSTRLDPELRQRQRQPLGLLDIWKYGAFIAVKATGLAFDILSHCLWGPRRKTWGWEMTLISSFMRNSSNHSHLADLTLLRKLISVVGFVPLPADAMVTPVTFHVRRRKLRGLLGEVSSTEDGTRELSGEWVVGKELWKKLQADWKASKNTSGVQSSGPARKKKDRVILYLHGGAYYMFSAATHRQLTIQLSKYTGSRVFAVDYRLAPETRFPGQLLDVFEAYMRLLDELHVPPENVLIAGDSAGGGLTLALLMYLRDNDYALPAGAILMSPWVDLTMSCDSWDTNAAYDIVPMPKPDHMNPISCYLGEDWERYVTHPYASPLFGDFHNLPPLLIQVGDSEVLRDEITLLAHKASMAGVQVRHELYEDAVHVFQTFPFLETSRRAFLACRDFVKNDLPLRQRRSPQHLGEETRAGLGRETGGDNTRVVRGDGQELDKGGCSADVERTSDSERRISGTDRTSWTRRGNIFPYCSLDRNSGSSAPKTQIRKNLVDKVTLRQSSSSVASSSAARSPLFTSERNFTAVKQAKDRPWDETDDPTHVSSFSPSAPAPAIREKYRAISHPDISSLCQQWARFDPPNRSTHYVSTSRPRS
ncbi:hypothetical protein M0805_003772 [Coniferiporia weirii]|nr:hypothetical protein M0805_003772 [Coniferiporia weirii]